jgi:hypothetical protein
MPVEAALISAVLLLSAAAMLGALLLTRQDRLERERRIALVAKPLVAPTAAIGAWLKGRSDRLDVRLQRFLTGGTVSTWGMRLGTTTLILLAIVGSVAAWALTNTLFGIPFWLAAPAAAAAGYGLPRTLLLRQQAQG